MAMIDANRRPSTLLSDRPDYGFRTSESCDMARWSPDVQPIDESIAALLGIAPEQGETMQGQRYAPASSSAPITTISMRAKAIGKRCASMADSGPGPR